MTEKESENSEMSEVMWISERLREDVAPRGSVKARIREAATKLQWKYSRTKDAWYGDERISIKPRELRRVEQITGKTYAPHPELRSVDQLIANAEALMDGTDPDFHRGFVAALRAMAGALDRTGTR